MAAKRKPVAGALVAPAIGKVWRGQGGVYAGVMRGRPELFEGRDYHLIIGPEVRGEFDNANKRCSAQSVDGHTDFSGMYRREQSLAYANVTELFERTWYWSRKQHESNSDYAWCQSFGNGRQGYWHKGNDCWARAVRRIPLQSFINSTVRGA
jgi:hypothetical protein